MSEPDYFDDKAGACRSLVTADAYDVETALRYPKNQGVPPATGDCGDGRLLSTVTDSSLHIKHHGWGDSQRAQQLQRWIERSGKSAYLYPVPDEIGDYIHVYWTTVLRDYLDVTRQAVENRLQANWSIYHESQQPQPPQPVILTYNQYVIEPAYKQVHDFLCAEDYRYFYLTAALVNELVVEALSGNIVQSDSMRYIIRLLSVHPLESVKELYDNYREQHSISRSAQQLLLWIEENKKKGRLNDAGSRLMDPTLFKADVQKLFLMNMLYSRAAPLKDRSSYDAELRGALLNEVYVTGQVRQLLSTRLRDASYYEQLKTELAALPSSKANPENVQLFLQELQSYTIPFKYDDGGAVRRPERFKDAAGAEQYIVVERQLNPVFHTAIANVFIPPADDTDVEKLKVEMQQAQKRISGRHHYRVVSAEFEKVDRAAGILPLFLTPLQQKEVITASPLPACYKLSRASTCSHVDKKRRTAAVTLSFMQLALLFIKLVNSVNKDDLRRMYSEAYDSLTRTPLLLSYTTAYGPAVTERMLDSLLRRQIVQQLNSVWDSIRARFIVLERATPAYTLLSLMLHPTFRTFLAPEQRELAQRAWDGFEATAHDFAASTDSCTPKPPVTEHRRIRCVLINSSALMKLPAHKLRSYHKKDIIKGH